MKKEKPKRLDLVIKDCMGGDYALLFIEPELMDELKWTNEHEIASEHMNRVTNILNEAGYNKDPRIIKRVGTQAFTDPEYLELPYPIEVKRILSVQAM